MKKKFIKIIGLLSWFCEPNHAIFNRKAKNIIDYVKKNEDDLWEAVNIGSLNTKGFEFDLTYRFGSAR